MDLQAIATGRLGDVHGLIGLSQQFVNGCLVATIDRDAQAWGAALQLPLQLVGLIEGADQLFTDLSCKDRGVDVVVGEIIEYQHELIASESRHSIVLADIAVQSTRDLDEQ